MSAESVQWIPVGTRLPPVLTHVEVMYSETGETDSAYLCNCGDGSTEWDTWKGLGEPTHWRQK